MGSLSDDRKKEMKNAELPDSKRDSRFRSRTKRI